MAALALPLSLRAQTILDQTILPIIPGEAVEPGVTVLSRNRPEYGSYGVRLGELTIRSGLSESVGFEDNVLATKDKRGSAVIETAATVAAQYDHSDTTASVTLDVDDNRYPEITQQSYTNWSGSLGLAHNFGRDVLNFYYSHQNQNQTARDLDVPQLINPLQYRTDTVQGSYRMEFSRVFVQPGLLLSRYDYDNGAANGVNYIQSYRNRTVVEPSVTLGYELAPQRDLTLTFRETVSTYSMEIAGTPGRDSHDKTILAGVDSTEGNLWRYRVLVGYKSRTFVNSQIKSIQGPIVEADAVWNPTGLTTVTGTLTRQIVDSADEATVGVTETSLHLQVDHELRRNVLLQGRGTFYLDQYGSGQGSQSLYTIGAGARWLLNHHLQLSANYDFTHRSSGASNLIGPVTGQAFGGSYSDNRYLLNLHISL